VRIRLLAIVVSFIVSVLGSVGFAATYVLRAGHRLDGISLTLALGGLAIGVIVWAVGVVPPERVIDQRDDYPATAKARSGANAALEEGIGVLDRHRFVFASFLTAFGTLGLAALFPLRSLAPGFRQGLYKTKWRKGARLVRVDGTPVRASDLEVGSVVTVFPDGFAGDAHSQTLLMRLPPHTIRASAGRESWSPQGFAAFSKVCTHAGCPVGLYLASKQQLLCPCHQSIFDVAAEAKPISGPASRPLPQLPLEVAENGNLQAQSDFREPIGPGFWQRS
jgi:ubiquinol-cytochrome c reductase iron-sulfur subunit